MRRRRGPRSAYDRVVVVGAGRAGVAAAEELRRAGFRGEVRVLGDEPSAPYDRPACSKGLLTGHRRPSDVRMPVLDGAEIDWHLGRRAVHLDPDARIVTTDTGERFGYDGLVIATGARTALPRDWPVGEPGLHTLRTLADAWALRGALRDAQRVVVIGAGLTGCEVASAVRTLARDCVLVDSSPYVLGRAVGETVGRLVTREVARDGVQLRLGRRVTGLNRRRRGWLVELDDGDELLADLVVTTTGERPDVDWLDGTGIDISDGVRCDESLRVLGVEGVVAAGTVARWPNLRYSARPRRCAQWIAALQQGRAAAHTLLAGDREVPPVTVVPRFWSDQYGLRIQVCGELPEHAEVMVTELRPGRRDVARAGVLVGYHDDGRLVGLVAVNAPHAFTSITRSMLATTTVTVPAPAAAPVTATAAVPAAAPAARRLAEAS
ncbi:NAD/ferredoxin-dependent reductase-like protein [Micromonospora pisi]|uniref:NAD/ferredoxin-dependent reductase-like protein n=1 Tax=Micromonospora pisi TaxID=589240 RepID=A0A495JRI1_9ACTN|nr:FAD-dependent oxidoreductase [Micromonospora pisi]RKR90992.1 NAD/ferredoxin-dependent reductase-like protein [Micromonospora pisi]